MAANESAKQSAMRSIVSCYALAILLFSTIQLRAENWPGWRGPRGDGQSAEQHLPIQWRSSENVAWKVPLVGEGHASPILWKDHIFLVSCIPESGARLLLALDRKTGSELWRRTVIESPLETKHSLNSFASSTPATDGQLVYVTFLESNNETVVATNVSQPRDVTLGKMVVAAYDFSGNQQWIARPGEFVSVHGYCSCPVLYENSIIVNGDHDGDSYIVALDKRTGSQIWKVLFHGKISCWI